MRSKIRAIIISVSSDIGRAIFERWSKKNWDVYGTYRTETDWIKACNKVRQRFVTCNLSDSVSVDEACLKIHQFCPTWDILVLCPGTQEPIGAFTGCDFDEWERSIKVNFTSQLKIVHKLLLSRNINTPIGPCVLFFAGGGTNNATVNYSAYTVSKIALIKMCELLDAEIPDTRFAIVGPGWVKTKIHMATLKAKETAGENFKKTKNRLSSGECTPMKNVLDCCDWVVNSPRKFVSGRNFSVVFDKWGSEELKEMLLREPNMYKLRRYGNDLAVKKTKRSLQK